jgi:ParB-like chromosome segregation protein Spo0J
MSITITAFVLSKLTAGKDTMRRVDSEAGLMELSVSIQAYGLKQNLTVQL